MSNESSEEKTEPGSDKKLRDARQKGQMAKSQDMITALVVLASTVYLGLSAQTMAVRAIDLFDRVALILGAPDMKFSEVWGAVVVEALDALMSTTFPLFVLIVLVVFIGNVLISKGIVFSTEPIKPDIKRVDPISGFKRLFSLRNVVEFLKALLKVAALSVAFFMAYKKSLPFLFGAPSCGADCLLASFNHLFIPIAITAILAFLGTGILDLLLQKWLFARDMRMSHSEVKRERKDMDGAPEIRKERHRQRMATQAGSSARGEHMASVMIGSEKGWIVGIRYIRGETKVPVVVHVVPPDKAAQAWAQRHEKSAPYVYDPSLAGEVARQCSLGEPLPERHFGRVAEVLVKVGLI
ncbi:EscU/YscU/HrcU family type III secretion system export apparatus switch protein [Bordetella tumulicola]|uniref:EscU/YscU/HrcU family type III secretion system export apparatus switch protein n=1 Tax=Bordetella tumulicola TaxID=1649133 RepID=UPI0039EE9B18